VFKVSKKIDYPADCEVRSVIRFLNAQNVRAIDIHRQLTAVHGEGEMNELSVRKWYRMCLLSSDVMLLHENARPYDAARKQAMLQEFGWEVFEHPAVSPDLAPSDFHLFQN
jgi:hypothetical protein